MLTIACSLILWLWVKIRLIVWLVSGYALVFTSLFIRFHSNPEVLQYSCRCVGVALSRVRVEYILGPKKY